MVHHKFLKVTPSKMSAVLMGIIFSLTAVATQAAVLPENKNLPRIDLQLTTPGNTAPLIKLKGAKNERLLLRFGLMDADPLNLDVRLLNYQGYEVSKVDLQEYQLRPVPAGLPSNYLVDGLVKLGPGAATYPENPMQLVVRLKIKPDHPQNSFYYKLVITSGDKSCTQLLKLTVWPFTLPEDTSATVLGIMRGISMTYLPDRTLIATIFRQYLADARNHKINGTAFSIGFNLNGVLQGKPISYFKQFDNMMLYAMNTLKFKTYRLVGLPGADTVGEPGSTFASRAAVYYPAWFQYLQSRGWVDKGIVKVWDEPLTSEYPKVAQAYNAIKAAAADLRTECGGYPPDPSLWPVVEVWDNNARTYDKEKIDACRTLGQEQWLYANKLHQIDQPPANQRIIGWYLKSYNFTGYLVYALNDWAYNPWTTIPAGINLRQGTFYYPDPDTAMPLPTLRLEAFCRGLEDYQYWTLLDQAYQQGKVSASNYNTLQQLLADITRDLQLRNPLATWDDLETIRTNIGDLLFSGGFTN